MYSQTLCNTDYHSKNPGDICLTACIKGKTARSREICVPLRSQSQCSPLFQRSYEWNVFYAPETDPKWRPRHLDGHRDKTTGTRWVLCTIWLCCSMEQTAGFVWSEENWPPTEPGFSQGFFSILSLMEFRFLWLA